MNGALAAAKSRRFRWGLLLAWSPFIFLVFRTIAGFINAFRGISEQQAMGIGAVAAGVAESFTTFGLFVTLVLEAAAIVLLLRTFSKDHFARSFLSVVSLCCSAFMIFSVGFFLWFFLSSYPHPR